MAGLMLNAGAWTVGLALAAATVSGSAQATGGATQVGKPAQTRTASPAKESSPLQLQTLNPTTQADPFPVVNPANFTADSPSVATVDSYLHTVMGFDVNRIWRVLAIQKTIAPGVSRVVAAISERTPGAKVLSAVFYVLPDGKHLIASDSQGGGINPFGMHPYADNRAMVMARADGPAHGSASKDLMLVEFSDLQCPHCKEAQPTMDRLAADFPKARIVVENFPLEQVHPYALEAAEYGVCVARKSDAAFFTFAKAVYDTQAALVPATADATLKAAAGMAGENADAIAACAKTPQAKAEVDSQVNLGKDLGVDQTPTLVVNGRLIPLSVPYETLKNLIAFQASLDGVSADAETPSLTAVPAEAH